jgi:hypothetical protein
VAIRTTRRRISTWTPGRPSRDRAYVHFRPINSRCHRRIVSGVTIVATSARSRRPRRRPMTARRRRSSSFNRSRCPCSCALRTRFSSRRNSMTSRCSRSSQPNDAAMSRYSGITHGVYGSAAPRQFLDTTASPHDTPPLPAPQPAPLFRRRARATRPCVLPLFARVHIDSRERSQR